METPKKRCQWRDCTEEGHGHATGYIKFKAFDGQLFNGSIYLCNEHCEQAKRTGHMDILISGISMGASDW